MTNFLIIAGGLLAAFLAAMANEMHRRDRVARIVRRMSWPAER